jgi:dihydrodipicolinate synthase/N-acetylneuraminate lyase
MQLASLRKRLFEGLVIPAHPLALTASRGLDERRQRALTRYYLSAGAGGVAVGVHTTQFAVHENDLYVPVLELAEEECRRQQDDSSNWVVKVAGIVGHTANAINEASIARQLGYDCGLVSLSGLVDLSEDALIDHCRAVAEVIPVFGFYLQPAVGGRTLPTRFWRKLLEIENVVAIKIAPFDRYETVSVVRAVAESNRIQEVALYTGNDDNIIADLLTPFRVKTEGSWREVRMVGGLLGQWAVWTRQAVELLDRVRVSATDHLPELMTLNAQLTDANGAIFDARHSFKGCIPGIHEVLRRVGLLGGTWCLDPKEMLSPGQAAEIERICRSYPHLTDDTFVKLHLDDWLRP